jgi:hypothetical protein
MVSGLLHERAKPGRFTRAAEEGHMDERNPKSDSIDSDDVAGTAEEDMIGKADEDEDFDDDEEDDDLEDEDESVEGE